MGVEVSGGASREELEGESRVEKLSPQLSDLIKLRGMQVLIGARLSELDVGVGDAVDQLFPLRQREMDNIAVGALHDANIIF